MRIKNLFITRYNIYIYISYDKLLQNMFGYVYNHIKILISS